VAQTHTLRVRSPASAGADDRENFHLRSRSQAMDPFMVLVGGYDEIDAAEA
jgi:hypothetical protein